MSAAVDAIINQWMVPHLNAHKICTGVLEGNIGSVRRVDWTGVRASRRDACTGMGAEIAQSFPCALPEVDVCVCLVAAVSSLPLDRSGVR